ncbi:hypothetical protein [Gemella sanguinis]|uniref:Lipoprotein n=1 Tax=Gemella sanguinis TaxID=84135 RepID=A0A2N6SDX8_9BACL|nr:hypothetical protein [Gemella sanguinis]PMC52144.1 hypothetical protein CJ218_05995 [Gemella sanguinis]
MNKLLKTTGVFILGVGLLTGCSHTSSQKSDNSNESSKVAIAHVDEGKDKNDNGNNVTEENSNNNVAQENNSNNTGYKATSDYNDQNSKIAQNNSNIYRAIHDSSYANKVTRNSEENNKVVKDNDSTSKVAQKNSDNSKVAQNTKKTQQNASDKKVTVANNKVEQNNKNVKKDEKKSVEQKNVKNNNDVKATEQKNPKADDNSKAAEKQNNGYKHNFKEVEKLLNVINYSLSNTKNSKMIDIIRFSASISSTQNQVVYLPAANLLDRLNTNNAETYNVNAVLNKLFVENGVKLVTANKAKSEYTPAELEKLVPDNNTVVYFKKDNMFAIRSVVGYGGTTNSIFAPTEDWKVEGDKILIPYVTVATNKPTGLMTVRLNNKVYPNGQNKTMYYVESFIYY